MGVSPRRMPQQLGTYTELRGLVHGVLLQYWGIARGLEPYPPLGASNQQAPKKSKTLWVHQVAEMAHGRRVLCVPRDHTAKKQKSQKVGRA